MKSAGWIPLLVVCCVLVSSASDLWGAEWLEQGSVEFRTRLAVAYDDISVNDENAGSVFDIEMGTFTGYFLTDMVELGTGVVYTYTSVDPAVGESSDRSAYGVVPEILLNFETFSDYIPFIGAGAGVVYYSGDFVGEETTWILPRVEAGVRWLITDFATVNFTGLYSRWSNVEGEADRDANRFGFTVGISVFP